MKWTITTDNAATVTTNFYRGQTIIHDGRLAKIKWFARIEGGDAIVGATIEYLDGNLETDTIPIQDISPFNHL